MTSVIVSGARTPMGRLLGNLKDLPATELGAVAIRAALARGGTPPADVQYVIMGQVLQAGAGQMPARQAAVGAGIPMSVPALTVNKVCLSGLTAIALADQLVRAGECDIVVAGGMESMTNAPHLLLGQRRGYKYGDVVLKDHLAHDGLTDVWDQCSMGESTERHGARLGISRAEQDEFSAASHQRAAAAMKNGAFADEITEVTVRGTAITEDEGVRPDSTPETLARLRPAFTPDGTITAGSSSPLSDGAAAVLVMRRETAEQRGLSWIAEIGAHGMVAGPDDSSLHAQPANAIRAALAKAGLTVDDLDLVEINEAFAQVVIASMRE
ncbi:MAG TPA: acetyl-CoA C-acyltransferase, partial [Natronosporangium sp.]